MWFHRPPTEGPVMTIAITGPSGHPTTSMSDAVQAAVNATAGGD
jgi:hypothetical protein